MKKMSKIIELPEKEFVDKWYKVDGRRIWYLHSIRGFAYKGTIYLRKNAFYLFKDSKAKVIEHEEGHIIGLKHTWTGIMSWHGIFRL